MGIFGKLFKKSEPIKEVLTAEELGAGLYKFVTDGQDSEAKFVKKHNIEPSREIRNELFFLKVAAVGLYIHMKFYDDNEVDDVPPIDFLDSALPDYLERAMGPKPYFQFLTKLSAYEDAYSKRHPKGPAWQIGKHFAKKSYGDEMSLPHILLGSAIFTSTWNALDAVLKEIIVEFGST